MAQREAIIELHRAGKKNSDIIKLIKAPKSTVYNTIKRFKELGNASDRPRSGRPRTPRTQKLINTVKTRVTRIPKRSMRRMAREMDVSEPIMRIFVKTELKLSTVKMQPSQHLMDLRKILTRAHILQDK